MSKQLPLVSIIIPVYNVEKYLPECLESVINQIYSKLEIILVDDGSPDKCGEICDKYAAIDSRIKVIHKENGGVSSARNVGIDISTGDWIYFMDSDDTIEKDLIGEALNTALTDGTDMCFFDYDRVYEERNVKQQTILSNKNVFRDMQNIETLITYLSKPGSVCLFIINAKAIRNKIKFDEKISLAEDELFEFKIYCKINSFSYIHKIFYHYRIRSSSACGTTLLQKKYPDMMYHVYRKMKKFIEEENYPDNAIIVPNTRLISRINIVVNIAFQNRFSLKCDYEMIKNYMNTDEYMQARINYDKNTVMGFANKLYVLLKKPNRFFITLIYLLSQIKAAIIKKIR